MLLLKRWFSSYGWLALKNGLKTADHLLKRGILVNSMCAFCHDYGETHSHLFFECDFSFGIINSLIPQTQNLLLRPNLLQAFEFVEDIADNRSLKALYYLLINSAIYFIWRARNDRIFGNLIDCRSTVIRKIKRACHAKVVGWKNANDLLYLLD
ncbi:hypothetical protein KFK09_025828 [Dendrobium nobile]|uniref:Reverse transcriptase zinc-binding domain-containing protein n=1 Tax=Dendrobium nobile TaxID=94219 RepID=A0A8T3A613_DENNO|nr:hypothetical protein KFK09_025828 [Dendrobium nobile]